MIRIDKVQKRLWKTQNSTCFLMEYWKSLKIRLEIRRKKSIITGSSIVSDNC